MSSYNANPDKPLHPNIPYWQKYKKILVDIPALGLAVTESHRELGRWNRTTNSNVPTGEIEITYRLFIKSSQIAMARNFKGSIKSFVKNKLKAAAARKSKRAEELLRESEDLKKEAAKIQQVYEAIERGAMI